MPSGGGLIDGDLPHAIERVLPAWVLVAGYKLAGDDGSGGFADRQAQTLQIRQESSCFVRSVGLRLEGSQLGSFCQN
jgi:hypothetical protein